MTETKILPCPYCGEVGICMQSGASWEVTCDSCGVRGPEEADELDAISAWNTLPRYTNRTQCPNCNVCIKHLRQDLEMEREDSAKLKKAVVECCIPLQVLNRVHSDGKYLTPGMMKQIAASLETAHVALGIKR